MVSVPQEELPRPIQPVPDRSVEARHNIAYRGTEQHGVPQTDRWSDVPAHETTALVFPPAEPEPEPIPVRIVHGDEAEELRRLRVSQTNPGTLNASMVAPMNKRRTNLKIRNMDAVRTVFVGDETMSAQPQNGYPIPPGTEWVSTTQSEVYAQVDDTATMVRIAVMQEYATDI